MIYLSRQDRIVTSHTEKTLGREVAIREETLANDPKILYDQVIHSIETKAGKIYFLDAPGCTGKTFLINLLLTKVRSNGNIALAVASSGIAATLLEGAFELPLNVIHLENPVFKISNQSNLAQVLRECKLIVWDESTMSHFKYKIK